MQLALDDKAGYWRQIVLSPPSRFVDEVTSGALQWMQAGLRVVLVTLAGIDGHSPRPAGSQMAVNENGGWIGQISSDCVEEAIVREALDCIAVGVARTVRFGRGSKYIDVRLPCGSGLDIHFDPAVPLSVLAELDAARRARIPAALTWTDSDPASTGTTQQRVIAAPAARVSSELRAALPDGCQARCYQPATRVLVAGRGSHADALIEIARNLDWEVAIASPNADLIARHEGSCIWSQHLTGPGRFETSAIDDWTAVVLLFHDHDWEPQILARAVKSNAFYIGALGSRQSHAERLKRLHGMGVSQQASARIKGPVGLDIGASTPPEVALAIAGEIIAARKRVQWPLML
ncbi:MAG: XdhC family protein [Hyphomicrobiaceae bacterium]|nr:XdhC family protein [Hyphomicrobiaceae bacterium]